MDSTWGTVSKTTNKRQEIRACVRRGAEVDIKELTRDGPTVIQCKLTTAAENPAAFIHFDGVGFRCIGESVGEGFLIAEIGDSESAGHVNKDGAKVTARARAVNKPRVLKPCVIVKVVGAQQG